MGFLDSAKKVGLAVVTGGASTLVEHRRQQKLLETGMPGARGGQGFPAAVGCGGGPATLGCFADDTRGAA
jgi:hypothetical protein